MKKSLIQLFSVVDGRLSTDIGDVYEILNHVCDADLSTHQLPPAMKYLAHKRPRWFCQVESDIQALIAHAGSNEWDDIYPLLKDSSRHYDVPQLKEECYTGDFVDYMVQNSLLR